MDLTLREKLFSIHRPLWYPFLAYVCGLSWVSWFPSPPPLYAFILWGISCLGTLTFLVWRKKTLLPSFFLLLSFFLLGLLRYEQAFPISPNHVRWIKNKTLIATLSGTVLREPEQSWSTPHSFCKNAKGATPHSVMARGRNTPSAGADTPLKEGKEAIRLRQTPHHDKQREYVPKISKKSSPGGTEYVTTHFLVSAQTLTISKNELPVTGIVRVVSKNTIPNVFKGDTVTLIGKLVTPANCSEDFNYVQYLAYQGIYKLFYVERPEDVVVQHQPLSLGNLAGILSHLRQGIRRGIDISLPPHEAALVEAVTIADRSKVTKEMESYFARTGTIHILVIAGLHVGLIALALYGGLGFLGFWGIKRTLMILLVLLFYGALAQFLPPVNRSLLIISLFLLSTLLKRRGDILNALLVSAFFLLLVFPLWLYNVSFQMTYVATTSIVLFGSYFKEQWEKRMEKKESPPPGISSPFYSFILWIKKRAFDTGIVSLSAWIGIWPLSAYYFKNISLSFLAANIFILPLVTVFLILSLLYLPYFLLVAPTGTFLVYPLKLLSGIIIALARFFSAFPLSCLTVQHTPGIMLFIYYLWPLGFLFFMDRIKPSIFIGGTVFLMLLVLIL